MAVQDTLPPVNAESGVNVNMPEPVIELSLAFDVVMMPLVVFNPKIPSAASMFIGIPADPPSQVSNPPVT